MKLISCNYNHVSVEFKVAKEEEEPKQLTLDEWKALQTKKDQPKFNLRKAGEGYVMMI